LPSAPCEWAEFGSSSIERRAARSASSSRRSHISATASEWNDTGSSGSTSVALRASASAGSSSLSSRPFQALHVLDGAGERQVGVRPAPSVGSSSIARSSIRRASTIRTALKSSRQILARMRWSYASAIDLAAAVRRASSFSLPVSRTWSDCTICCVTSSCISEDVLEVAVEAIGPDVAAARGVDELHVDAHLHAGAAHAAFEHVAHAELPAHLLDVDALLLVGERRVARDHEQAGDLGDVGDDVFGDAVGEVFLLGIAAHVGERQHRERGLVGQAERLRPSPPWRRRGRDGAGERHPERAHRVVDVLHLLLALVDELREHPPRTAPRTASETVTPPGSASACSRAAMFTPSP
jgi:hypothetical protein